MVRGEGCLASLRFGPWQNGLTDFNFLILLGTSMTKGYKKDTKRIKKGHANAPGRASADSLAAAAEGQQGPLGEENAALREAEQLHGADGALWGERARGAHL